MGQKNATLSWRFMSGYRTALAVALFIAVAALLIRFAWLERFRQNEWTSTPDWSHFLAFAFAVLALYAALRGGGWVDSQNRCLVRWWGLFFPLRTRYIKFEDIETVIISPGMRPGSPQAAHKRDFSFNVAVKIKSNETLVIRLLRKEDEAREFGLRISSSIGCPLESRL